MKALYSDINLLFAFFLILICTFVFIPSACATQSFSIGIQPESSLPQISFGNAQVFSVGYAYWGQNWSWVSPNTQIINSQNPYKSLTGYKALNLTIESTSSVSSNKVSSVFKFDASADKNIMAGGLVFHLDTEGMSERLGQPEILPNKQGWAWGKAPNRIEFILDKPVKNVFFERGRINEIRVYFHENQITNTPLTITANLTTPSNTTFFGTDSEKYHTFNFDEWLTSPINRFESLADLSFLNANQKPAGKHGFIKALNNKLMFEDGTVGRFWGTNITAYALFSSPKDQIKKHAHRLSMLGYNLVRLHHLDSPWVSPNIFGKSPNESTLNIEVKSQDLFDWWIKCLKDEGIYIWLDLHVDRHITIQDGIDWIDEIVKDKPSGRLVGYNYVNQSIENKMQAFNVALLTHVNSYTQTALIDEPAIIGMLITNENDVTNHYGNRLLPDKHVKQHNAIYTQKANVFAKRYGLPEDRVWRSWENGPSKLFLNELEHEFNGRMIQHLKSLGVKVPIVTTSTWGNNPVTSLPTLTTGDIIDVHAYQGTGAIESNPLFSSNFTHWINAAQLPDKPLSVTEWGWETNTLMDRHTLAIMASAYANLGGWDALMQYAYSQSPLGNDPRIRQWESLSDPSVLPTMAAGALLYRQNHLNELRNTFALILDKNSFYGDSVSPNNSISIRTASEKGKLYTVIPYTPELSWFKPTTLTGPYTAIKQANQNMLGIDPGYVRLNQLERHWDKGYLTINTDKSQIASGWIGNQSIMLADTSFNVKNKHATIAVQTLDDTSINNSSKILISLGRLSAPKKSSTNQYDYVIEPLEGTLTIKAKAGLKVYKPARLDKLVEIPFQFKQGLYYISLVNANNQLWLVMK